MSNPSPTVTRANHLVSPIKIRISPGEWCDRHSILGLKHFHLLNASPDKFDSEKAKLVLGHLREMEIASPELVRLMRHNPVLRYAYSALRHTNEQLWGVEDALRRMEQSSTFDEVFIVQARKVYKLNDHRTQLKNEITGMFFGGEPEIKILPEYKEWLNACQDPDPERRSTAGCEPDAHGEKP